MLRRLLPLALAAILPVISGHAAGQTIQARPSLPAVAIGDGISSFGDLNTDGRMGGDPDDRVFDRAIDSLPDAGGVIAVGSGTYYFDRWVTVTRDNIRIVMSDGATIIPRHTGTTGVFRAVGVDSFRVEGGRVLVDTWVDDQIAVEIKQSIESGVHSVTFEATTTDGDNESPARFVYSNDSLSTYVHECRFLPNKAFLCVEAYGRATGLHVDGNYAGPADRTSFAPAGGSSPTYRMCYGFLLVEGNGWCSVTDNRLWGLGDPDDDLGFGGDTLAFSMRFKPWFAGGSPYTESGHSTIADNKIELVAAPYHLDFWAWSSSMVTGNLIGYNDLQGSEAGHSGIRLTGLTGEDYHATLGEAGACVGIQVRGNDLHNLTADSDAAHIYVDHASNCDIDGNTITVASNNGKGIHVAGHVYDVSVSNNRVRAPAGNTSAAITLAATVASKIVARDNYQRGFATLLSDSMTLSAGAYRDVDGYGPRYATISSNESIGYAQDSLILSTTTASLKATLAAAANFPPGYVLPIYNDSATEAISVRNPSDVELVSLAAGAATRVIRSVASDGTTPKWYLE